MQDVNPQDYGYKLLGLDAFASLQRHTVTVIDEYITHNNLTPTPEQYAQFRRRNFYDVCFKLMSRPYAPPMAGDEPTQEQHKLPLPQRAVKLLRVIVSSVLADIALRISGVIR
jgi:hypothetical protein